jgi:hypothetical protein
LDLQFANHGRFLETLQSVQGVSMQELEGQLRSRKRFGTRWIAIYGRVSALHGGVIWGADTDQDFLLVEIDDSIHKMEAIHGEIYQLRGFAQSIVIERGLSSARQDTDNFLVGIFVQFINLGV